MALRAFEWFFLRSTTIQGSVLQQTIGRANRLILYHYMISCETFLLYLCTLLHCCLSQAANNHVALLFYWGCLNRQVRVEGRAIHTSDEESNEFFANRPHLSQVGAIAAERQSHAIPDREVRTASLPHLVLMTLIGVSDLSSSLQTLRARFTALKEQYEGKPVPRPDYWCVSLNVAHDC